MKLRTISLAAVALAIVLLVSASQIIKVYADNRPDSFPCSSATLNGVYGFYGTGITTAETGGVGPYAAVGTLTFDGKGNYTRKQSVSRNGAFERNHASFQYEVAGNCTGKALFNGGEFETFVIVEGGSEIYILKEGAQTTYLVAKKIHP
jgi:hypothetical protein